MLSACHSILWPPGMDTQLLAHALSMRILAADTNDMSRVSEGKKKQLFVLLLLFLQVLNLIFTLEPAKS